MQKYYNNPGIIYKVMNKINEDVCGENNCDSMFDNIHRKL